MTTHDDPPGERRGAVLRALVSHYVRSGEPVASKTLVDGYNLKVSPATVRNDMAALEEGGYIYQPHTSAGRIPTDLGYRFYVDEMSRNVRLPARDAARVRSFFGDPRWELEDALRQTASLLSGLTDHAAVVFAPALDRSTIRHAELVGLSGGRAMVVLVTHTGRVENHVVLIPEELADENLDEASEALNRCFSGVRLEDAAGHLARRLGDMPVALRPLFAAIAQTLGEHFSEHEAERMFLEGTSTIVDEHKFADLETVRGVIEALEHRRLLLEVLADALSTEAVSIRIGAENTAQEMRSCSVVTAPYVAAGEPLGSLGVVGPTRMNYRRTIAAVHEVAAELGRMLTGLSG